MNVTWCNSQFPPLCILVVAVETELWLSIESSAMSQWRQEKCMCGDSRETKAVVCDVDLQNSLLTQWLTVSVWGKAFRVHYSRWFGPVLCIIIHITSFICSCLTCSVTWVCHSSYSLRLKSSLCCLNDMCNLPLPLLYLWTKHNSAKICSYSHIFKVYKHFLL